MPKSRSPRIEIKPEVWPALQVEAITRRMSPKDLVNILIMEGLSPKAREFMDSKPHDPMIPQPIATETPENPKPDDTRGGAAHGADKRKRLADNPDALEMIKKMWSRTPRPTFAKMVQEVGYPKTTIIKNVKRMKDKGELVD